MRPAPGGDGHPRADRVAAAAGALEGEADPVVAVAPVVAEEARRLAQAEQQHVGIAVVVEVAHRDPAAHARHAQRLALGRDVREPPALALEQERGLGVADLRPDLRHGREGVARAHEDVGVPVVVVVEEARAEGAELEHRHAEAHGVAPVDEPHPSLVALEEGALVVEVHHQQVQSAVPVHVLGVGAHGPCRPARGVEGHLGLERDVPEAAVAEVAEEEVRRRVVRLEDVDPAVVVEVGGDDAHALAHEAGDARPGARVLEGAVAAVAVEAARLAPESPDRAEGVAVDRLAGVSLARRPGSSPGSSRRRGRAGRRGRSRGRWCCSPRGGSPRRPRR